MINITETYKCTSSTDIKAEVVMQQAATKTAAVKNEDSRFLLVDEQCYLAYWKCITSSNLIISNSSTPVCSDTRKYNQWRDAILFAF